MRIKKKKEWQAINFKMHVSRITIHKCILDACKWIVITEEGMHHLSAEFTLLKQKGCRRREKCSYKVFALET